MAAVSYTVVDSGVVGKTSVKDEVNVLKYAIIKTANTVDATDTIPVTFAQLGITTLWSVDGWKHTTDDSVIVTEAPTTAVSAGVLTITVPAGTDNDTRIYKLIFE